MYGRTYGGTVHGFRVRPGVGQPVFDPEIFRWIVYIKEIYLEIFRWIGYVKEIYQELRRDKWFSSFFECTKPEGNTENGWSRNLTRSNTTRINDGLDRLYLNWVTIFEILKRNYFQPRMILFWYYFDTMKTIFAQVNSTPSTCAYSHARTKEVSVTVDFLQYKRKRNV